jgi:hypothetical protein
LVKTHVKNRVTTIKNLNDRRVDMSKLGTLAILVALAAVIYVFSPSNQVQVAKELATIEIPPSESIKTQPTDEAEPENSQSQSSNSLKPHRDHEGHDENEKIEIPQYIKDSLETKRIPASALVEEKHADGTSSIDFKGQYQHVPVAIIGEDGKVKITETRIEPIAGN